MQLVREGDAGGRAVLRTEFVEEITQYVLVFDFRKGSRGPLRPLLDLFDEHGRNTGRKIRAGLGLGTRE